MLSGVRLPLLCMIALVLAPTRELCLQILTVLEKLLKATGEVLRTPQLVV